MSNFDRMIREPYCVDCDKPLEHCHCIKEQTPPEDVERLNAMFKEIAEMPTEDEAGMTLSEWILTTPPPRDKSGG